MELEYFNTLNRVEAFYTSFNKHMLDWIDLYIFLKEERFSLKDLLENDESIDKEMLNDFLSDLDGPKYMSTGVPSDLYDIYVKNTTVLKKVKDEVDSMKIYHFKSATSKKLKNELLKGLLLQNSDKNREIYLSCIQEYLNFFQDCIGTTEKVIEWYDEVEAYWDALEDDKAKYYNVEIEYDDELVEHNSFERTKNVYYHTKELIDNYLLALNESILIISQKIMSQVVMHDEDSLITATQKLLFIRLLQDAKLFPDQSGVKGTKGEYIAIAKLTGLDYEKNFKGVSNPESKVFEILQNKKRQSLKGAQINHKINDLTTVQAMLKGLNVDEVIETIKDIIKDLEKIKESKAGN